MGISPSLWCIASAVAELATQLQSGSSDSQGVDHSHCIISQRARTVSRTTSGSALFHCSAAGHSSHTHRTGSSRFSVAAPSTWNSLPADIQLCESQPSHFQTPLENPSVQTHLVLLGCIMRLCIFGPKGKSIIIVIIMNALWLMSIILVTKVHMNNLLPESIHDSELAAFTTSHATYVSSKLCFKKTQFRTGDFRTLLSLLLTFRTGTISVTIRFNGCRSSLLV